MTREQARRKIDSLDFYLQNHTDDYGEESHTAMMMAIEALEQEPCEDAISRQAVLDAFDCSVGGVPVECVKYVSEYANKMVSRINALPSVQPESEHTMEEFMYGNDLGSPEDGSL